MFITILIACRDFPFLYGLESLTRGVLGNNIKIDFAFEFKETIKKLKASNYDLLISNSLLNGVNSFKLVEEALVINSGLKILIVRNGAQEVLAPRYLDLGAYGYINSTASVDDFKAALRNIINGQRYFLGLSDLNAIDAARENLNIVNPFSLLSKREFEVMIYLLEGKYIKEIANQLCLSMSSVSTYRSRILHKLKLKNVLELMVLAKEFNLIDPGYEDE